MIGHYIYPMRIIRILPLIVFGLFLRFEAVAAPPADVELINDSGELLQPSSTLEFRFVRPIIDRDLISGAAAQSPIVFQPDLPGRFTWLSRRSGVFIPENAPPLGVSYQVSIRRGLNAADGKPIGEKFRATLRTPLFGIIATHNGVYDKEDVDPKPKVRLVFNSEVVEKGAKIPSVVRSVTSEDESDESTTDERDWEARWHEAKSPTAPENAENKREKTKRTFFNQIIVSPATN